MEILADLVDADWSRLPESSRESVRFAFADFFAVSLAGVADRPYRILADYLRRTGAGPIPLPGGSGLTTRHAAIGWGALAHGRDYDDVSEVLHGHPSAVLIPAVLALGHQERASGAELADAYLSGYEVIGRIGACAADEQRGRGWHTTATIGVLGATIAAARLLRLNRAQARHALGIATSLASGVQANFGSMTKPLHAGWAAGNGVLAAELAAAGFEAGTHALTSDASYLQVFGGTWPPPRTDRPYIDAGIRFKPYPCCGSATGLVDCAVRLHPSVAAQIPAITAVTCTISAQTSRTLRFPSPVTGDEARFSPEFCVAQALTTGELTERCFREESPALLSALAPLMRKVTRDVLDEATLPSNAKDVRLTVTLSDGREITASSTAPKGHPRDPMSRTELRAKFEECTRGVLTPDAGDTLFSRLCRIDQEPSAADLLNDVLSAVDDGTGHSAS